MSQNWLALTPNWEPGLAIQSLPVDHLLKNEITALLLDVDGTLLSGKNVLLHTPVREWVLKAKE